VPRPDRSGDATPGQVRVEQVQNRGPAVVGVLEGRVGPDRGVVGLGQRGEGVQCGEISSAGVVWREPWRRCGRLYSGTGQLRARLPGPGVRCAEPGWASLRKASLRGSMLLAGAVCHHRQLSGGRAG
jgi:hypothetical protein